MARPHLNDVQQFVARTFHRGYIPDEVPPAFSGTDFALAAHGLTNHNPTQWTAPVDVNVARTGPLRRRFSIPNPFSHLELVRQCCENWAELRTILSTSPISLSNPARREGQPILGFPQVSRPRERLVRMPRARFTLRADISNFYNSVYTHAIDWAIHSKAAAKKRARGRGRVRALGAKLDKAVGTCQQGETKGIPIGPSTSLLIAELILCPIDAALIKRFPSVRDFGLRFVDDFEYYAESRYEAEQVLQEFDSQLSGYDLSLNPTKTEIIDGPIPLEAPWKSAIRQFRIRTDTERIRTNDLRSLYSIAIDLLSRNPADPVLSYTIARSADFVGGDESWSAATDFALTAATAQPSSLRYVSRFIDQAVSQGRELDVHKASDVMNAIARHHAPYDHGSEVAWSLYIIRSLGSQLDPEVASLVAKMQDNCSLLLLRDLIESNRISGPDPNMTAAIRRAEASGCAQSSDWLLGYECARNGWSDAREFMNDPDWAQLLTAGVKFFASSDNAEPPDLDVEEGDFEWDIY